ncbi:MAG: MTAP family purine nucleoside phosphorylase [Planctomycetota bacterium]|jgi:5'-methylthioadenosine phosphorylase
MSVNVACIAGEEIYHQWNNGRITGEQIGSRQTPFGTSGDIFLVDADAQRFYLLPRYGPGVNKNTPHKVNSRANLYALKDLGVQYVLDWGPGGAITHNVSVGDLVILNDVIDFTYMRDRTFFEHLPLGFLRQFPVFCPTLRRTINEVLHEMKILYHATGTAAVREGPRLETPAEVRMLATIGAEIVTHNFAPDVFLAKELQLCHAAICYVVNYAETGSRRRTFATGDLFGGLTQKSDAERLAGVVASMSQIVAKLTEALDSDAKICECEKTMAAHQRKYALSEDWREWFA